MNKIHIAVSTHSIEQTVIDYTNRLGVEPSIVISDEYALWRTESCNFSIRKDLTTAPGQLRHLGFEVPEADAFSAENDVNGIIWERFDAKLQAEEIRSIWPGTEYSTL